MIAQFNFLAGVCEFNLSASIQKLNIILLLKNYCVPFQIILKSILGEGALFLGGPPKILQKI